MAGKSYSLTAGTSALVGGGIENAATIMALHITALSGATVTVSGNCDGAGLTNDVDLIMRPFGSDTGVASATAVGAWRIDVAGLDQVYVSCAGGTCTFFVNNVNG